MEVFPQWNLVTASLAITTVVAKDRKRINAITSLSFIILASNGKNQPELFAIG